MTTRQEVYSAIDSERDYQDAMWGDTLSGDREPTEDEDGGDRTVDEFSVYLIGYANDLLHNASHFSSTEDKLEIIRKLAGLSVACMEQHGAPRRAMPEKLRNRKAA